jgi:hypothetical protein
VRRRSFLIGSATSLAACKSWLRPSGKPEAHDEHDLKTIAAIADTFLPGDDGTPGAHEANALATIVDPAYGLAPYVSEVVSDLDEWCLATKHKGFIGLDRADRELVLEQRMGLRGKPIKSLYLPVYEGILQLAKLAYFGALTTKLGTNYLAFPTASTGYAPGSAAGAWASREAPWPIARGRVSAIKVDGAGDATMVRVSAFVTTDDDVRATIRIHAPGGGHHDLPLAAPGGEGTIDHVALPASAIRGPAAGEWRLEIAQHGGGDGRFELWSLVVRTDLDDKVRS